MLTIITAILTIGFVIYDDLSSSSYEHESFICLYFFLCGIAVFAFNMFVIHFVLEFVIMICIHTKCYDYATVKFICDGDIIIIMNDFEQYLKIAAKYGDLRLVKHIHDKMKRHKKKNL